LWLWTMIRCQRGKSAHRIKLMLSVAFKNLKKDTQEAEFEESIYDYESGEQKSNPMCKRKICIWDMENIIV